MKVRTTLLAIALGSLFSTAAFAEGVIRVFAVRGRDDESILVVGNREVAVHLLRLLLVVWRSRYVVAAMTFLGTP